MPTPHFTPDLFRFLRKLQKNNTRDWFAANKPDYERHVRDPLLRFIEDLQPRMEKISPHIVVDPSPTGGSMFRVHRDTRFSKDKSPYKTAATAQFRHEAGRDVHAPGFYLHLEPGQVFMGAGIWHPDGPTLKKIREHIAADPAAWKRTTTSAPFKSGTLALAGESLARPPRGYDPDHPAVEDLKRKDFMVVANLDEAAACAPSFLADFTALCRKSSGFVAYIAEATDLPF